MATLRQAVERLRDREKLPRSPVIGMRGLLQTFRPTPAGSTRALVDRMFGSEAERLSWAVILCRFKGERPDATREDATERLYRGMFAPRTGGLVEYWRDVSLGAIDVSGSRVFGWLELDLARADAGIGSGANRSTLVDAAIAAAQRDGLDPINGFHSQIAVFTRNWSKDGAPAGADWRTPAWSAFWIDGSADGRGKVTLTPPHDGNITAHEMGHGFGMQHDVSVDLKTHYADPCCIMSQASPFTHPVWRVNFGPALCLPHLVAHKWMYKHRVFHDGGAWLSQPNGISVPLASISDPGAHANLGVQLAYTNGQTAWDYYLEYARPREWNQGLTDGSVFIRRIAAADVGPTPSILGSIRVPATVGVPASFLEPIGNVWFEVQRFDAAGRIVKVTAKKV